MRRPKKSRRERAWLRLMARRERQRNAAIALWLLFEKLDRKS
jgi:hypothetical protein